MNNYYLGQKDEEGKEVIEELEDEGELKSKEDSQEGREEYEDEGPRQGPIRS
ncbi:MAG TPA: hypothetical protein VI033_02725 [Candidatus Nitrosopolaris sp.]